jgi:phosphoglycerate dehydrogenase-like enzyme
MQDEHPFIIGLTYSNYTPSAGHIERLKSLVGRDNVVVAASEQHALELAPTLDVLLGHRYLRQMLPLAPKLRWVQTTAGGYDQLPFEQIKARGITLTRNTLNSEAIAHHALALTLALTRRLPYAFAAQQNGLWAKPWDMPPLPRTALVLGLGAIGSHIARLLRGMGLYVRGATRQPRPEQRAICDECLNMAEWRDALAVSDILVLALPLNAETEHCIGADELAMLPAHAVLINVARGGLVDEKALIRALSNAQIGGAALDHLDQPWAPEDPVWHTPNLIVTPKVSAYHPAMQPAFEAFAETQVSRYLHHEQLQHQVV